MDVQCERCKTEYEFDDALVSGRGTTVKCTNCGLQFKVRKPDGAAEAEDDRWLVQTKDGMPLVFTTLKELQRAILANGVGRHDTLTRGTAPPRPLGSIAELAPFFDERKRSSSSPPPGSTPPPPFAAPPPRRPAGSNPGIDVGTTPPMGSPVQQRRSTPPPPPARTITARPPDLSAPPGGVRPKVDTLRPPSSGGALPPLARLPAMVPVQTTEIVSLGAAEIAPDLTSPLPKPTVPVMRQSKPSYDETADPMLDAMAGADHDPVLVPGIGGRRRVGGWVIAALLVGCVSVGVFLMARPYMAASTKAVATSPLDPRAQEFLRVGERALDDGDLEAAKENFDKASVVADRDTRVLVDLARLAAARADVPWLRQRLGGDPADPDTKRALGELGTKAKNAAEAAMIAAPEDPAAIRAKIDALRITGDRDAARGFVSKVIANASQPETAYVLAALDLAEPEPLWQTVIERLRVATQAEGNAGRARAALIYALARSGDAVAAKSELDKLNGLSRPHPLASSLRGFVEKMPARGRTDGGLPLPVASAVDVRSLPKDRPPTAVAPGNATPVVPSADTRALVFQANTALARRDYARASQLYAAALDKNPSDSEAQGGLGDVAHAQHDLAGAKASYSKAVALNAHYLPALVGLGDVEWEMGDKVSAQKRYKVIVDNFPDGSYPGRVKERSTAAATPPPTDKPLPTFPIPPRDPATSPSPNSATPAPTSSPTPAPASSGTL